MVAAATLALTGFVATSANANLPGSTFEGNDGNLVVNTSGNTDWNNVSGRALGIDIADPNTDNAFGNGAKEDLASTSIVDGSIPPNKNNLSRFYEANEQLANGHIMLYLGWERLVNIGNANLDFEINQKATAGWTSSTQGPITINRTAGDLLVTYDFGGSGTPTLGLNTWVTTGSNSQCFSANAVPCWGKHVSLSGTNSEGAVNGGNISDTIGSNNVLGGPGAPGTLSAGLFGESAIDLTAAGVFPPGVCEAFGSAFVKSRSSSSFTAELKDFIAPVGVSISNCGSITINKVTQNAPTGDNTTFNYTTTGTGLSNFGLKSGGTKVFSPLNAGSYSVTEGTLPAGWDLNNLTCDTTSGVTIDKANAKVSINLANGQNVTCTYTNHFTNSPGIVTSATTPVNVGTTVHDTATLSGASATAGGTITFKLYPSNQCTAGSEVFTNTQPVSGNGSYTSGNYTTTAVGSFYWIASYSGDSNNNAVAGACQDTGELSVVNPFTPTIVTHATDSIVVGNTVHDVATLSGATTDAKGTVTFTLYSDNKCTAQVFTDSQPVNGNGDYTSSSFTPATVGTYYWIASYSGDAKNTAATGKCGDLNEASTVIQIGPSIATHATGSITIGGSLSDTATLAGGLAPTGTITFKLYPTNQCTPGSELFTNTVPVSSGNGDYPTSASFTPSTVGSYYWIATYSGDTNNAGAAGSCGDAGEVSVVNQAHPQITTTTPTPSVTIDSTISDVAHLTGGVAPTGTITFHLYSDNACQNEIVAAQSVKNVTGNGDYLSDAYAPTVVGTYYWIAVYSGDTNNAGATGAFGDPNESSTVNKGPASLTTTQTLRPQDAVNVVSGVGSTPSGTVTFSLFDPSNQTCAAGGSAPVYTETVPLNPSGSAVTNNSSFTIGSATSSQYKWLVSYSGDATHLGITGTCGGENFTLSIDNGGTVSSP
jgi:hypothetical protein